MRNPIERSEEYWDDGELSILSRCAGSDTGGDGRCGSFRSSRGNGSGRAVEQNVDDVLRLRRFVGGERLSLSSS